VHHQGCGHAADAEAVEFLVGDPLVPAVDALARAAIGLGITEAEQADGRRLGPQLFGDLPRLVPVLRRKGAISDR
jgi:hypothetical protein